MMVYKLGQTVNAKRVGPMLKMHGTDYIYVFTDGHIIFTDKKLNGHDTYTKLLEYNVYGYAAYTKVGKLPKNKTLFQCKLVEKDKVSTTGTIVLIRVNVFEPIPLVPK